MQTVITRVVLREGDAHEWDDAMRERLAAARDRKGWLGGQLLKPEDTPNERVIVGTWESREDWAAGTTTRVPRHPRAARRDPRRALGDQVAGSTG